VRHQECKEALPERWLYISTENKDISKNDADEFVKQGSNDSRLMKQAQGGK
jgi:hypothetical protein